ncbi:hypothetical protein PoB_006242800 [Plakobranchus ocellatus]|uniref:Uncharacterized protein n=1 Tax=Plakobranchus ocellatus TaxID=259542 RepID=A0AAV4CVJ7_9GAST|nr:hypothetical protein PoB_006242800 [Plakobranchus ocellatus]
MPRFLYSLAHCGFVSSAGKPILCFSLNQVVLKTINNCGQKAVPYNFLLCALTFGHLKPWSTRCLFIRGSDGERDTHVELSSPVPHASPQQGDLRLSGPPSGQDAGGGARTRDRRVPADLRADSLATVPPTPLFFSK